MASFTPPLYNSDVFNPSLFDYASESLTLDTADKRYLKLTGGSITGNLFVSGVVDCGTLTIGGSPINLSYITGITPGTAAASKALVLDSNKDITGINSMTSTSITSTSITSTTGSFTSLSLSSGTFSSLLRLNSVNTTAISTTAPASDYSLSFHNADIAAGSECGISFMNSTSYTGYTPTAAIKSYRTGSNGQGGLVFCTKDGTTPTSACGERMRINQIGFVGISNINPSYLLDVGGTARILGDLMVGDISIPQGKLHVKTSSASGSWTSIARFEHSTNSALFDIQSPATTSTQGFAIGAVSNHQLGFMTNNSRKMILTTGGSLRIDDGQAFELSRDILTGDLNSRLYSVDISSLIIESARGNGWMSLITNRAGVNSDSPCIMLRDGSIDSIPYLTTFRNGCIVISQEFAFSKPSNDNHLSIPDGQVFARTFTANGTNPSNPSAIVYDKPHYMWLSPNGPCGLGTYNSGTRALLGTLSNYNDTSGTYTWNTGLSAWAGSWNTTSDIRSKKDIVGCPYGLKEVLQMHPCEYTIIGTGERTIGLIAQELLHVAPACVEEPDDPDASDGIESMYGINYNSLIGVLVKAIQEQQKQIDALIDLLPKTKKDKFLNIEL